VLLQKNETLRFLDISRNQLTKKGIVAIEKGLSKNPYLQKIILGGGFQKDTKQRIKDLLEQNRTDQPYDFEVSEDVKVIRSRYR
jgi:hypothetical protein